MHVDKYGLPTQANGDANDQLARESMLLIGQGLLIKPSPTPLVGPAMYSNLQPSPGIYARYTGAPTDSTSADQLISALGYWVTRCDTKQIVLIAFRCISRLGFAQNYRNTLDGSNSLQVPDFMLLRALPLFARAHKIFIPCAFVLDALLVLSAIAAVGPVWRDGKGFTARTPDDVDDNVLILTLLACRTRMVTPLSRLACLIYAKYRPTNLGCALTTPPSHPVIGALRWYHRAESGGNPEIGEAIIPAVQKYILN